MESIEKTGDYSIRFTWKRDSAGEFEDAMSKVLVVSQKAYEESGDCMRTKPVGTGPYYVKDWSTGTSLTLAKNENYWQKPELCGNYQKQNAMRSSSTSSPRLLRSPLAWKPALTT